jgi:hypothetical protein
MGDVLIWGGQQFSTNGHRQWDLLKLMWSRQSCQIDDAGEKIWGSDCGDGAIKSSVYRLNAALDEVPGFPWRLSLNAGQKVRKAWP